MTITILDGGMGDEIAARLEGAAKGLWSATALLENPDMVVGLHKEYIEAGARIIITNTYSTIPSYLAKAGLEDRYVELARLGGELARDPVGGNPGPAEDGADEAAALQDAGVQEVGKCAGSRTQLRRK